ncbi:methylaspartate mutase sigma subunit [Kibdelosporangium banguiense]|uniref:Methylaspartate mutase sigma subunit n=1 Tax=Kibdelosporangium banguiense TaxID=1365924 RepID=A0ABS4TR75_9PSEU|nr:methylaspartate mutase sigma subunit [Kibdelosporangium banguiense]
MSSDSHTWNLVYLQLAIEELGHRVINLGACVPDELLVDECLRVRPGLVVVSSVNGHGFIDGMRLIAQLRARPELAETPVAIGGMLGIAGPDGQRSQNLLRAAGYTAVFDDGARMPAFRSFVEQLDVSVNA